MENRKTYWVVFISALFVAMSAVANDQVESLEAFGNEACTFHEQARDDACGAQPGSAACRTYEDIFRANCTQAAEKNIPLTAVQKSAILQSSRETCEGRGAEGWFDCECEIGLVRKSLLVGGNGAVGFAAECVDLERVRQWGISRCETTYARVVDDDYCACFGDSAVDYMSDYTAGIDPVEDEVLAASASECRGLLQDSTAIKASEREEMKTYSRGEIRNLYDACMRSLYSSKTDEQICQTFCAVVPERCENPTLNKFL
jgi:hypothetical protein